MKRSIIRLLDNLHHVLLSAETKEKAERWVIYLALGGFLSHLLLFVLYQQEIIEAGEFADLLSSPIAAVYTPFSFILIYEVYLLVYYLPASITTYIGKQYEIISLVIIRRLFKDLANLDLASNWFENKDDLQFTFDLLAAILMFGLIYVFNQLRKSRIAHQHPLEEAEMSSEMKSFILIKRSLATLLVPVLVVFAIYSFFSWSSQHFSASGVMVASIRNVDDVFFGEFFTILIMVDIILLLFSLLHTDNFYKVMRNSGFIISTILIRISFGVSGLINVLLILAAVLTGILVLWIHNLYEQAEEVA